MPVATTHPGRANNKVQHTIDKPLGVEIQGGQPLLKTLNRYVVESDHRNILRDADAMTAQK